MEGTAEVVVSLASWVEGIVSPTTHEIIVRAPKKGPKPEPVTNRLLRTLVHPDRRAMIGSLKFSDDGNRFLTSGYPSGIVQVWDTKTWKETARVDTPPGLRSSAIYANLTPDWNTLLVDSRTRKVVRQEKDGKVLERLQIDGRVDVYDAHTGKLRDSIPFADRGPSSLFVLPGGKHALVNTEGSFEATATTRPVGLELLDLAKKTTKKIADQQAYPGFAPDGRTIYLSKMQFHPDGKVTAALVKYDVVEGKELKSLKPPDAETFFDSVFLSPNGKWLVTSYRKLKPPSVTLTILSPDTLEEVARLPGPKDADRNTYFEASLFSPDGNTLVTRSGGPLIVWDLVAKKMARTIPVGEFQFARLAMSPDGRRVAVAGMPKFTVSLFNRDPDPSDLPQPRVELVDLSDPASKPKVLMLPHGAVGSLAFSPDGKTLAVGSSGGVHLLDVADGK